MIDQQVDSSGLKGEGISSFIQRYVNLRISGYLQPQFQFASAKGSPSFSGGNFAPEVDNRFMIRRGRFRLDYFRTNAANMPSLFFGFQFDGTERGVNIRDFYGKVFENKWNLFSITTGMFPRPFGNEILLSSNARETPERGRMSQLLMNTERDLGVMLSFEPQNKLHKLAWLKMDLGVFNGPGLPAVADIDRHKDLIGRISTKGFNLDKSKRWLIKGGASGYLGGLVQNSRFVYEAKASNGEYSMVADSSQSNVQGLANRTYGGADVQLLRKCKAGNTEIRAEFILGTQPATATSSQSPFAVPKDANGQFLPTYIRSFNGAYFYFIQNIFNAHHQIVVKYDWYDPNSVVSGKEVRADKGFTAADIKFNTLGFGYIWYLSDNFKLVLYYDWVQNEHSGITGFEGDANDNIFTARVQYKF
ncbi:MAG: porin [Saprospiraceae bacterium]